MTLHVFLVLVLELVKVGQHDGRIPAHPVPGAAAAGLAQSEQQKSAGMVLCLAYAGLEAEPITVGGLFPLLHAV